MRKVKPLDSELRHRINGIEGIVFGLVANGEVLKFLAFELHPKAVNIQNNEGLFWIWQQLLGLQVIDLYKLFKSTEKHSIEKFLNVAKAKKLNIGKSLIDRTAGLKASYSAQPYEAVRSKFVAHQDLNLPKMDVDLLELDQFVSDISQWFTDLKASQNLGPVDGKKEILDGTKEIRDSLAEVFKSIDEWDRVQAFLLGKVLTSKKTVRISDIQKLIK